VFGQKVSGVSFDRKSPGVDEELLEVPGDVRPRHRPPDDATGIAHQRSRVVAGRGQFVSEPLEDGVGVCAVDENLLHQHRFCFEAVSGSDVTEAGADFLSIAVLLMAKLIARECQDDEAIAEALQQLVHLLVVPGGRSSQ